MEEAVRRRNPDCLASLIRAVQPSESTEAQATGAVILLRKGILITLITVILQITRYVRFVSAVLALFHLPEELLPREGVKDDDHLQKSCIPPCCALSLCQLVTAPACTPHMKHTLLAVTCSAATSS